MNFSFAFKLGLSIFCVGGASTFLVTYLIYTEVRLSIWNSMSSRLQDLNRFALSELRDSHLQTIKNYSKILDSYPVRPEDISALNLDNSFHTLPKEKVEELQSSPEFLDLIQFLRRIKYSTAKSLVPKDILPQSPRDSNDIPVVRFAYIAIETGNTDDDVLRFIADSDYQEEDINKDGVINPDEVPSEIGEIFLLDNRNILEEAKKGYVSSGRDYSLDRWGIWISSMGPILDESGNTIAYLGIDLSAQSEFNLLRNLRFAMILVALSSIILSFLMGYFISRSFSRPIQNLILGAEAVSKENFSFRVKVDSSDELGTLARAFNQMIDSVRDMKNKLTDAAKRLEQEKEDANIQKKLAIYSEKKAEIEWKKSENLNRMIRVIIESKSIGVMFTKIHELLLDRYNLRAFTVFLVFENNRKLKLFNYYGTTKPEDAILRTVESCIINLDDKESIHAKCTDRGRSVLFPNIKNRNIFNKEEIVLRENFRINGIFIIPLLAGEDVIGTIDFLETDLENSNIRYLSKAERQEVETFVRLITPSIYQVLQKETIEKALGALQETSQNLLIERDRAKKAYVELEESMSYIARSDRMIMLGTMVAGVAHEINTPLGAIRANSENISESMNTLLKKLNPHFSDITRDDLSAIFQILELSSLDGEVLSTKEIRAIKKKVRSILEDKNIPNPDTVADTIIELRLVDALEGGNIALQSPKLIEYLNIAGEIRGIQKKTRVNGVSAERIAKIVKSLKSYMHFEQKEEKVLGDISEGLDTVLTILHNKLKYGIEVTTKYGEIPKFYCYPDELNQVWTNLIHNSIQAMNEKGKLLVEVTLLDSFPDNVEIDKRNPDYKGKYVAIAIQDSGVGIPPELRQKIFQAFFTTKKAGEGSGLGLHIIGRILEKHGGALTLESEPGRTRFTVLLPFLLEESLS